MATRSPFINLPTGCDPLAFDINIVPPQFTFCSVPNVTLTPMCPMTFHLKLPDNVPAPFCPCPPTLGVSKEFSVNSSTQKVGLQFTIKPATTPLDCCDPKLTVVFNLDIPCMPLGVQSTGTAKITLAGNTIYHKFSLKRTTNCTLKLTYDLRVPCMPLAITRPAITFGGFPSGVADKLSFVIYKTTGCQLAFNILFTVRGIDSIVTEVANVAFIYPNLVQYKRWKYHVRGRVISVYNDPTPQVILAGAPCPTVTP